MKLSDLYGKQIINKSGKTKGCVLGALCEGAKITALKCCDSEEKEFTVSVNSVISAGEIIIYEYEGEKIKKARPLRLGMACYSENGRFLGHAADFECRGFILKSALIGKKKYAAERLCFGDVIIVKDKTLNGTDAESAAKDMFINAVCG